VLAEDGAEYPELRAEVQSPAEHIRRLDQLISDQAGELAAAHTTLREITALCDLAEWATESTGDGAAAVVLVDELRRVLARRRPAGPGG
jgi:hypothetical protein